MSPQIVIKNIYFLISICQETEYWSKFLKELVLEHSNETGSSLSKKIIDDFENELKNFVQVCPKEMLDKLKNPVSTKTKVQKVS